MADSSSRTGVRYASPEVLSYVEALHVKHDGALEAAFTTPAAQGLPEIQLGPSEGKLLELVLRLVKPMRVVEVGTLAGYSALWIARALAPGGHLWTLESEPKHHRIASELLQKHGLSDRVTCMLGDARSELTALAEEHAPFDAVFLDADKGSYDHYGQWAAEHLRSGGLLLADNAYFFGRLLETSADAAAMRRFHEAAALAFDTVCIPTPDGLLLGVKH